MNLHPFMVEAIYLRMHPNDCIEKDSGQIIWFCEETKKYVWKYSSTSPKHKTRNSVYEAKGLMNWWNRYLKLLEETEFKKEEGLPY